MIAIPESLRHPVLLRVARVGIGLVFLAAAVTKIADPAAFAGQVHNYRLAPIAVENLIAMTLPWVELVAGLSLVLGVRARAGAIVAFVLMGIFTIGVGSAWARGLDFECGCFGKASAQTIGASKFLQNVGLVAVAAIAAMRDRIGRYLP